MTAYEMRISDWSSDVCSSDLQAGDHDLPLVFVAMNAAGEEDGGAAAVLHDEDRDLDHTPSGRVPGKRGPDITSLSTRFLEIHGVRNAAWRSVAVDHLHLHNVSSYKILRRVNLAAEGRSDESRVG